MKTIGVKATHVHLRQIVYVTRQLNGAWEDMTTKEPYTEQELKFNK